MNTFLSLLTVFVFLCVCSAIASGFAPTLNRLGFRLATSNQPRLGRRFIYAALTTFAVSVCWFFFPVAWPSSDTRQIALEAQHSASAMALSLRWFTVPMWCIFALGAFASFVGIFTAPELPAVPKQVVDDLKRASR